MKRRKVLSRGGRWPEGLPPRLTVSQILAWADEFHERTGRWPTVDSGRITGTLGDTWQRINRALRRGLRGLRGGSSLARLLEEQRGARNLQHLPPLSPPQILAWADAHFARMKDWPTAQSGPIAEAPGETWSGVSTALLGGKRGLPGGSSLARLLEEARGVRNHKHLPRFTREQILAWADAHYGRCGDWRSARSGAIPEAPEETWSRVESALLDGIRGLPGGSSLARLLAERRGVRNIQALRRLTRARILAWAEAHRRRSGQWPTRSSGAVAEAPGETWANVNAALGQGLRGLPGGSSLAWLLAECRGLRHSLELPRLRCRQILDWADAHQRRTGEWPDANSGPIAEAPGETWMSVDTALHRGRRGLPVGSSLRRLLAKKRGVRHLGDLPDLTIEQILAWADAHQRRTGAWPKKNDGPIPESAGETWAGVSSALYSGGRGLPHGHSLARLLAEHRGYRNHMQLPPLAEKQILAWADEHKRRTGEWPTAKSGPIGEAPEETWQGVATALLDGLRGLPGGSSLPRLLARRRGVRNRGELPTLTVPQILAWADGHRRRTGQWPRRDSGFIHDAPQEKWMSVENALRLGLRGLPGGSSLAGLLREHGRTS